MRTTSLGHREESHVIRLAINEERTLIASYPSEEQIAKSKGDLYDLIPRTTQDIEFVVLRGQTPAARHLLLPASPNLEFEPRTNHTTSMAGRVRKHNKGSLCNCSTHEIMTDTTLALSRGPRADRVRRLGR